ncbi:MAG: protein kinase [Deltaproteobacteria bacterium]|nr:protein kinase [Deltaproteobacteria bacterium]
MIGTVLDGRYRILKKLGEGGMGEVYLAEHVNLGRKEALKILQPELASDREFVSRFRREARATNRVQHPSIISVYDFGQLPDGRFYLTTEFAEGERVDSVLRRVGAFPVPRALGILAQLADAVSHAHAAGVIHRDLKPENMILVEHRGRADVLKVLDFGIAKIVAPDHAESVQLTRKGQMFGTPVYMPPEQAAGVGVDGRSDIYAIGVIAFELLVGEPPFRGRLMELLRAHATQTPDRPSARRPEAAIPPALDAIVLRCLEKKQDQRYQTAAELLAALERIPGSPSRRTPTDSRSGKKRPWRPADYAGDSETEPGSARNLWDAISHEATSPLMPGLVPTGPTDQAGGSPVEELRAALREAAEALIGLGANDIRLIVSVANLRDAEERLARDETELEAIDTRMADVDQAQRKREGAVRVALADLRFVQAQAKAGEATIDDSLGQQIRDMEARLARLSADYDRDIRALSDRAVSLAAERATAQEQIDVIYDALGRHVDTLVPTFCSDPGMAELAERVKAARQTGGAGGR